MILAYGFISLLFLWVLSGIITPKQGTQINGWRRANKLGRTRLPLLSDESNSVPVTFYRSANRTKLDS